jgi:hypothetical protein
MARKTQSSSSAVSARSGAIRFCKRLHNLDCAPAHWQQSASRARTPPAACWRPPGQRRHRGHLSATSSGCPLCAGFQRLAAHKAPARTPHSDNTTVLATSVTGCASLKGREAGGEGGRRRRPVSARDWHTSWAVLRTGVGVVGPCGRHGGRLAGVKAKSWEGGELPYGAHVHSQCKY